MAMGERCTAVLGNHDLHLLAAYAGVRKPSKSDTLDEVLQAPDAVDLIDWLRFRPLAHYEAGHLMVHAGVLAKWDVAKTLALAGEVEQALRGPNWRKALQKMYGNEPATWKDDHTGGKRMRVIINALTRIRLCTPSGHYGVRHQRWRRAPGRPAWCPGSTCPTAPPATSLSCSATGRRWAC